MVVDNLIPAANLIMAAFPGLPPFWLQGPLGGYAGERPPWWGPRVDGPASADRCWILWLWPDPRLWPLLTPDQVPAALILKVSTRPGAHNTTQHGWVALGCLRDPEPRGPTGLIQGPFNLDPVGAVAPVIAQIPQLLSPRIP